MGKKQKDHECLRWFSKKKLKKNYSDLGPSSQICHIAVNVIKSGKSRIELQKIIYQIRAIILNHYNLTRLSL